MKFFRKRWVAWTLCVLMVLSAVSIGQFKARRSSYQPDRETEAQQWAWDNYSAYEDYIRDDTLMLSKWQTKVLSVYNAASDYTYGSVCGLWIADYDEERPAEVLEGEARQQLHLDDNDLLLLTDAYGSSWTLIPGDDWETENLHDLQLLSVEAEAAEKTAGERFLAFYAGLDTWYAAHLQPANGTSHALQMVKTLTKTAGGIVLAAVLVALGITALVIWFAVKLTGKTRKAGTETRQAHRTSASERTRAAQKPQRASERQADAEKKDP